MVPNTLPAGVVDRDLRDRLQRSEEFRESLLLPRAVPVCRDDHIAYQVRSLYYFIHTLNMKVWMYEWIVAPSRHN